MSKKTDTERQQAIEKLREFIKPGMIIYTTLRAVSRSGMRRTIDLHIIENNEPRWIGWTAATAMGRRFDDRKQGILIGGWEMDMGSALVYELSETLWPEGFGCIGEKCRSNDHSNGDRDYTPHLAHSEACYQAQAILGPGAVCRNGCSAKAHWHSAGGYALRQQWL